MLNVGRFIPTHVGNTHIASSAVLIAAVHPHACGEHFSDPLGFVHFSGSSPRMWGTLFFLGAFSVLARFIPTHVGNTQ